MGDYAEDAYDRGMNEWLECADMQDASYEELYEAGYDGRYAGNFVPYRTYIRSRPDIKADFKSKQAQQCFSKYAKE